MGKAKILQGAAKVTEKVGPLRTPGRSEKGIYSRQKSPRGQNIRGHQAG